MPHLFKSTKELRQFSYLFTFCLQFAYFLFAKMFALRRIDWYIICNNQPKGLDNWQKASDEKKKQELEARLARLARA